MGNITEEVTQSEASWQAEIDVLRDRNESTQRTLDSLKEVFDNAW